MPRPAQRSSKLRKLRIKTPGGRVKVRFEKRRPGKPKCAKCKKPLSGVPRMRKLDRVPKSQRRPERPYANLCPTCARQQIKEKIYKLAG
ncbi:MAG: 50S ribosomal protein L34e [Candidatus Aenigmatarchaeota archaeon]|nr:MAG: 50S ribosomal protein L34e [Candidatus Aenigmarchaeota archaeon]